MARAIFKEVRIAITETAEQLMTAAELADHWQMSTSFVYKLARDQDIPSVRAGRRVYFNLDDVEAWEDAHHTTRKPAKHG